MRKCFTVMLPIHVIMLLLLDIWIYQVEIMSMVIDIVLIWLDFHNYMTLNKITIGFEVIVLLMTSIIALSHVQRVLMVDQIDMWVVLSIAV